MDVTFDSAFLPPVTAPANVDRRTAGEQPASHEHSPAASPADLGAAVTQLQDHVQAVHRELHFRIDEVTGQTVVRVVDTDTGALVRQMPSQEVLDTLKTIETMQAGSGLLMRAQA